MPPKGRGRGRGGGQQAPRPGQQPQRQEDRQDRPAPRQDQGYDDRRGGDRQMPRQPPQEQPRQPPRQEQSRQEQERHTQKVDMKELGLMLESKMALSTPFPPKKESKKVGRPIRLISNCYNIDLPKGDVYHYDIEIVSKRRGASDTKKEGQIKPLEGDKKYRCMSTKRNREIIDIMLSSNSAFQNLYAAFDGRKNMYTRRPLKLPSVPYKCNVQTPGDGDKTDDFVVSIQPVRKKDSPNCAINLDSLHALFAGTIVDINLEAIQAVETILRNRPCQRFFPVGRSFFYPPAPQDIHPLGGGKEIWFGFHQSLRLGQWKPMVNLDITATTFYQEGPVLRYICELLRMNERELKQINLKDSDVRNISKELRNMRIEVTHLKYRRKYRFLRLTRERADKLSFPYTDRNGQTTQVTVANYFQREYQRKLEYPNLPCIQVNPETKKIYLPIEVCEMIQGQHCKKKLEDRQNAEMIKFTARPPNKRFDEIRDLMKRADYSHDNYLREFGMKVYSEPLKLEGRVIGPPSVRYSDDTKIVPRDGQWDMRNNKFFRGANIENWVFLSFANSRFCSSENMNRFAKLLVNIANESGIHMQRPAAIEIADTRRKRIVDILTEMKNRHNAELAVVVVPGNNKSVYGDVKQAAETILGLSTQCVKDDSVVKKCNPPLVSNLCQKINAKMGGVNNSLTPGETPEILRKPVIIMGADVTHPSPTGDIKPSIAAAVGSLDSHPSRYAVTCRAQTNVDEKKQAIEIILDLKGMVHDLLVAFYKNTRGKKPEKIIFYRDGVSEGQFVKVREHEVKCIREACKSLEEGYEPGITFIVVQKRHHVRFMPQDSRDGAGKMRNIPPGTTVDNTVVHPLNFDFFLCSHFGLQGTSRPAHYTVLEDDNDFSADDLHKLTYYLCHTYVRCTKSISSPAPVMYAHLAAFRARQHLLTVKDESSAESTDSASTFHPLPDEVINAIKVKDGLKNTMYFV